MDKELRFLYNEVRELNSVVKQIWIILSEHREHHFISNEVRDSIIKRLELLDINRVHTL